MALRAMTRWYKAARDIATRATADMVLRYSVELDCLEGGRSTEGNILLCLFYPTTSTGEIDGKN